MPIRGWFQRIERMGCMVNFRSAVSYVRNKGNQVDIARLNNTINGKPAPQEIKNDLFAGQQRDGGWSPFWAKNYSSLDATCYRLAQADQLGILASEDAIQKAIAFLIERQRTDGSWEEDKHFASNAPPWVQSGEIDSRLYLSANCGFWLAILAEVKTAADKTATYLQSNIDEHGKFQSFPHTHWLAIGLWYRLGWKDPVKRVSSWLLAEIPGLPSSNLAWLLVAFETAGFPAHDPFVVLAAEHLAKSQQSDGHWVSGDGPEQDVHSTLEAIRALKYAGQLSKTH